MSRVQPSFFNTSLKDQVSKGHDAWEPSLLTSSTQQQLPTVCECSVIKYTRLISNSPIVIYYFLLPCGCVYLDNIYVPVNGRYCNIIGSITACLPTCVSRWRGRWDEWGFEL